MAREVSSDFNDYKRYLEEFSYRARFADTKFTTSLKQWHSSFLPLLTLCSELTEEDGDAMAAFQTIYGEQAKAYLREVVSDIGQAIFCLGSGAYKASLVTLRSSIESYVKCFSLLHDPSVLTQKSVHFVFEIAKTAPFFRVSPAKESLSQVLQVYDDLNLYVHTVTDKAMFHYLSLGVFPQYVPEKADRVASYLGRVTNSIVHSIAFGLRDEMFKIHHKNREVILAGLSAGQKAQFFSPD